MMEIFLNHRMLQVKKLIIMHKETLTDKSLMEKMDQAKITNDNIKYLQGKIDAYEEMLQEIYTLKQKRMI